MTFLRRDEELHPIFVLLSVGIGVAILIAASFYVGAVYGAKVLGPTVHTKLVRVEPANATTLLTCTKQGLREYLHACKARGNPL